MVYKLFDKKTGSGENVNEMVAQALHNEWLKTLNEAKPMRGLKMIFGQWI